MIWIADHGLIEIANLHMNLAIRRDEWTQMAGVADSANPVERSLRNCPLAAFLKPSRELNGAAATQSRTERAILRIRRFLTLIGDWHRSGVGRP